MSETAKTTSISYPSPVVIGKAESRAKEAIRYLLRATDGMIRDTGGGSGRDFTESEQQVFDRLIDAQRALQSAFPTGYQEVRSS